MTKSRIIATTTAIAIICVMFFAGIMLSPRNRTEIKTSSQIPQAETVHQAPQAETVYVCDNGKTEVYHTDVNCYSLHKCHHGTLTVTLTEARQMGLRKCRKCR